MIFLYQIKKNLLLHLIALFFILLSSEKALAGKNDYQLPSDTFIEGIVIDSAGKPISGANIVNIHNYHSTRTNDKGTFKLIATAGNILEVSHINYETYSFKVKNINAPVIIKLALKENEEEDVIVNSGYHTTSKSRSAGSFNKIDNALLNEQLSPNILNRLKDVSNIYFDPKQVINRKGLNLTVRGLSSIDGYTDPLIVLDNFPYTGNIDNINPNDIESVTILKDAAAASIWGAKAGNGVIVITTKKSRYNQAFNLNLNASITIGQLPDLARLPEISTRDFIYVENYLFNNNYGLADTNNINRPALTPVYEMLLKRRKGIISSQDSAAYINALLKVDPHQQYLNAFYQQPITQQYNASVSGGNNRYAWQVAMSYNQLQGQQKGNEGNKKNIRLENKFKPLNNLEIVLNAFYTYNLSQNHVIPAYNNVTIGSKRVPYLSFADENGQAIAIDQHYRGIYTDTAGAGRLLNWKYYPLTEHQYRNQKNVAQNLLANIAVNYDFLNSLRLSLNFQQEQQWNTTEALSAIESFYTRDLINTYTVRNTYKLNIPLGDILTIGNGRATAQNGRAQLNYTKRFSKMSVIAFAGAEFRETKRKNPDSQTMYGYYEDPLSFAVTDYSSTFPTYINGSSKAIPGSPLVGNINIQRFLSTYFNSEISYDQRYTINISARKDGSNTFGLKTNDKWNPFWSAGAVWNITKEKFFNISSLTLLKLRSTIGIGGSLDPARTALPVSTSLSNTISNLPIRKISTLNNPSLRWEQTRQINIAVDFEAFNHRINGSIDYYFKKSTDLYGPSPLDYTTWGVSNAIVKNVASMRGRGLEISLISQNLIKPVHWTSHVIFNYNVSKVADYFSPESETIASFVGTGGTSVTPVKGKPLFAIAAFRWGGLNEKGDPQGYFGGELTTDYQKIREQTVFDEGNHSSVYFIGSADPKIFGSFINTIQYKGFSLSANLTYKFGHYFVRPSLQYGALYIGGTGNKEFANRWQQPGDEKVTNVPAMVFSNYTQFTNRDVFYRFSDINVLKADHIRLAYVNLGYTFKFSKKEKSALRQLTLFVNMSNPGLIWTHNKEGIDPDYAGMIVPAQQFSFGVRSNF
jgi:TonB-linked SusC/RagA family outer membrane protein